MQYICCDYYYYYYNNLIILIIIITSHCPCGPFIKGLPSQINDGISSFPCLLLLPFIASAESRVSDDDVDDFLLLSAYMNA